MKKAFIETSAINALYDKVTNAHETKAILKNHHFLPVLGLFTTFELAKTDLSDKPGVKDRFKNLFRFIQALQPEFSCRDDQLFEMESRKLKFDLEASPLVTSKETLKELDARINRFCSGNIFDHEKHFLQQKENNFNQCRHHWGSQTYNPKVSDFKSLSEYQERFFKNYDLDFMKKFFKLTCGIRIPDIDIKKLMSGINHYPALRTHINFHLYLNFNFKQEPPATERLMDNIQLVEAAYFPVFISADGRHKKYAHLINPNIEFILIEALGID